MVPNDQVRINLPHWLQNYKSLRMRQQKCLDRIRHLSAALIRSRSQTSVVQNLVEYRRWLDFLMSLETEEPKMRFTDERQWQYGGVRNYYRKPRQQQLEPTSITHTVKLPKLKYHTVAKNSYNINRSKQKCDLRLPRSSLECSSSPHGSKCSTERSKLTERSGHTLLQDLRSSIERQESIPSKLSPRRNPIVLHSIYLPTTS